jgi:hypothetical protein
MPSCHLMPVVRVAQHKAMCDTRTKDHVRTGSEDELLQALRVGSEEQYFSTR